MTGSPMACGKTRVSRNYPGPAAKQVSKTSEALRNYGDLGVKYYRNGRKPNMNV